jgi:hypothetical protein
MRAELITLEELCKGRGPDKKKRKPRSMLKRKGTMPDVSETFEEWFSRKHPDRKPYDAQGRIIKSMGELTTIDELIKGRGPDKVPRKKKMWW